MVRNSNPDFLINPNSDPDPDVRRICLKMWMHYLVGVSHFAKLWYKSATDCMRNANKCPKIAYSAIRIKIKNVIPNTHADPDHHQKLITARGSPVNPRLCLPSLVDDRFRVGQLSCLQNDRQNDHITSALLVHNNLKKIQQRNHPVKANFKKCDLRLCF